jgi:RNA polymerase sigma factor (sigma-70 family)
MSTSPTRRARTTDRPGHDGLLGLSPYARRLCGRRASVQSDGHQVGGPRVVLLGPPLSQMCTRRRYERVESMDDVNVVTGTVVASPARDFDELFQAHFSRLARLIRRLVSDAAEAEDLAAAVLWKCFRKQPSDINLEGWLSKCAVRAALDNLRRKTRRARYEALWPVTAPAETPERLLERDQEAARVRRVLARLDRRSATLLVLRADGLNYRALAHAIGVRPTSIGTLLARAEARFRKEYDKRHDPR